MPLIKSSRRLDTLIISLLFLGAVALASVLPSLNLTVFSSPDETAAFLVSERLAHQQPVVVAEPLAEFFSWLHPRSWISQSKSIAPVGFLGWSWFLSFIGIFGSLLIPWAASIITASGVVPLFLLLKSRFGRGAAVMGSLVYATFPTIVFYTNRSLFSNGAFITFGLWLFLLIQKLVQMEERGKGSVLYRRAAYVLVGLMTALTLSFRPFEAIWFLPWLLWMGRKLSPTKGETYALTFGVLCVALPLALQANLAYGSPWLSGYLVHDNPVAQVLHLQATEQTAAQGSNVLFRFLPFGLHPRNAIWNIRHFLLEFLWPWICLFVAATIVYVRLQRRAGKKLISAPIILMAWTTGILFVVYGSGLYLDNVRVGAITIGNSFLRYLVPLVPILAFATAFLWKEAIRFKYARPIIALFILLLCLYGPFKAYIEDDEGLFYTRPELMRYAELRQETAKWFGEKDIILSERSDKIFFPDFRAVSPLPSPEEIGRLIKDSGVKAALYVRPLSQKDRDSWREQGIELDDLTSSGRERLYLLRSIRP